jgi:hypothetical protein
MKAVFVMLVMSTLAACTAVEQDHDDNTPNLGSAESELLQPHGGVLGSVCGAPSTPPCNPGLFCRGGLCRLPGVLGSVCGAPSDPPCGAGLFCRGGICLLPGVLGSVCGAPSDPPCGAGLSCRGGICG